MLKGGWTEDTVAKGFIQSYAVSEEYQWTAEQVCSATGKFSTLGIYIDLFRAQIWGFMEVNGERRYARRVKFMTPNLRLDKMLVYDYLA